MRIEVTVRTGAPKRYELGSLTIRIAFSGVLQPLRRPDFGRWALFRTGVQVERMDACFLIATGSHPSMDGDNGRAVLCSLVGDLGGDLCFFSSRA